MVRRATTERVLESAKGVFDFEKLLVSEGYVFRRQGVIGGSQKVLAVKPSFLFHLAMINSGEVFCVQCEVLSRSLAGHEFADGLSVFFLAD